MFSLPKLEQGENLATSNKVERGLHSPPRVGRINCAEKFEIGLKNTAFLPAVKEGKTGVKGPEAVFPISSH